MAFKFTNKKGKIRFYDGTAVTPYYLEIPFDAGDLSGPTKRNLPELIPVQDKGAHDANAHYILGPDEAHLEGLDVSFSLLVTDLSKYGYAIDWINVLNADGTTVNSNTIVTTKEDTQNDGSNNNPAFPDSRLALNIEFLLDGPSSDLGWQFNEVYIPPPVVSVGDDAVTLAIAGMVYGTITNITAFSSGADVSA